MDRRMFLLTSAAWGFCACGCNRPEQPSAPAPSGAPDLGEALFPDPQTGRPIAGASDAPVILVERARWTRGKPNNAQMKPMGRIAHITVHHTGFSKPWLNDAWTPTAEEIEYIREYHSGQGVKDRGWADIAYHFVIDRAGRTWQGRPLVYQGAHIKNHNSENLGIVMLGNFNLQRPSPAQTKSLLSFIGFLRALYQVPVAEVRTHGEMADRKTECPGRHLQAILARERASW